MIKLHLTVFYHHRRNPDEVSGNDDETYSLTSLAITSLIALHNPGSTTPAAAAASVPGGARDSAVNGSKSSLRCAAEQCRVLRVEFQWFLTALSQPRDGGPPVAITVVRGQDDIVLRRRERAALDDRAELVAPPEAAGLSRPAPYRSTSRVRIRSSFTLHGPLILSGISRFPGNLLEDELADDESEEDELASEHLLNRSILGKKILGKVFLIPSDKPGLWIVLVEFPVLVSISSLLQDHNSRRTTPPPPESSDINTRLRQRLLHQLRQARLGTRSKYTSSNLLSASASLLLRCCPEH
ncbi:fatty acid oxidation complex subunit alpha [Striga asiatica]|uniref:Fatty acid oxidation complex subunit alpha n=1 Tax=Striga asiatica TaxID=4170 RepID=A0A5A7Q7E5_STRAF|nr:fatty acid oxidation complex subunit alpha [Striga asiatica]